VDLVQETVIPLGIECPRLKLAAMLLLQIRQTVDLRDKKE
jgi:hypothetical protein